MNHLTVGLPDGQHVEIHRLGYESHQHPFDVDLYPDGTIRWAIDCREVTNPGPFHLAILRHFDLCARGSQGCQKVFGHTLCSVTLCSITLPR